VSPLHTSAQGVTYQLVGSSLVHAVKQGFKMAQKERQSWGGRFPICRPPSDAPSAEAYLTAPRLACGIQNSQAMCLMRRALGPSNLAMVPKGTVGLRN